MRIALLTDGIWPFVIGGMQKHSYYLCKYLAQRGIYVDLYHTSPQPDQIRIQDIFTTAEMSFISSHVVPFPEQDRLPGHYLRASKSYSGRIANLLGKNQPPDLIYAKGLTSWRLFENRGMMPFDVPVCINVHGYEYYQKSADFKQLLQQLMLRRAFSFINMKADYVYSYGGGISELIRKHLPEVKSRIIEIPTGISPSFLVDQPATPAHLRRFVFAGRFEKRKGIRELNVVLRHLKLHGFDFSFSFIGHVPYELQIQDPNITYHGVVATEYAMSTHLQNADVLVCPSYAEGMPNVIMEAMASGCAIIATKVGAVDLIVSNHNGWLIPPGSIPALKAAMIEALSVTNAELHQRKQHSVEQIRRNFLWDKVIEQQIASFHQIVNHWTPATGRKNSAHKV